MSEAHSKEQLIAYVKKAKLKIKKLEQEVETLKNVSTSTEDAPPSTEDEDLIASMWGGISTIATTAAAAVTEVTSVVQDAEEETTSKEAAPSSSVSDKEIAELNSQLEEKAKEIEVLTNQVIKAENKEMAATGKVIELEQKMVELEKGLDSASHESHKAVHDAKKHANESQKVLVAEQEKIKALETDLAQQAQELAKWKDGVDKAGKEEGRLTAELQEQITRAEKAENEILVLCEQVVARENEGKALQEQVNGLGKKLGASEELQKKTMTELKEANKKVQDKGKDNSEIAPKKENAEEVEELAKLRADLQTAEAERDALKAAAEFNTNAEKDTASKLATTEELQKKTLAKLKEEKKAGVALKKELTALKKQVEEADKGEEAVNALRLQLTQEKEQAVQSVQAELDALAARLKGGEKQAKELEEEQHALVRELRISLDKAQCEAAEGKNESQKATHRLEQRAVELEGHLKKAKAELEALQKETEGMSEQSSTLQRKLASSQKEAEDARTEREKFRKRVLELEGQIEQAELMSKETAIETSQAREAEKKAWKEEESRLQEAETSLAATVKDMEDRLKDALRQVKEKNVELARAEEESAAATSSKGEAQTALEATMDENRDLKRQLAAKEQEVSESKVKTDTLSNKIARLKTLLQRSKELAQEKESEVERLAEKAARAKRFQVLTVVIVPTASNDGQSEETWCLVLDHGETGSARWVEHTEMQSWLESGSNLVGNVPESLQTQHAREIKTVRIKLEKERDEAAAELKELSESFAAYKARAQTALKRVGNEERQVKEQEQERERSAQELSRLGDEIMRLERLVERSKGETAAAAASITSLQEQLNKEKEASVSAATEAQSVLASKEEDIASLQSSVTSLETRLEQVEEEKRTALVASQSQPTPVAAAVPATPIAQRTPLKAEETSLTKEEQQQTPAKQEEDSLPKRSPSPRVSISALDASARNHQELDSLLSASGGAGGVFLSPQQQAPHSSTSGDSMLLRQANQDLCSALADVRAQNSSLYNEVQDLTHKFALNAEQTQTLKTVIRELEATLVREREFNNTAPHAVNMEYLTNVIRKFLLSSAPSERAKLASVLCQILHFTSAESNFIEDLWREKKGLAALFGRRTPLAGEALPPDMER